MTTTDDTRRALALLTGPEAGPLLQLAITGRDDVRLEAFSFTVAMVHHRPGADTSVRYDVRYRVPGRSQAEATDARGETRASDRPERPETAALAEDSLVLSTAVVADGTAGVVELRREGERIFAWRYPGDPLLPAMAAAFDPASVAAWLGIDASEAEGLRADVVGHRPLRRATVRLRLGEAEYYVKTVRPRDAEVLVERHRVAQAAGVGPEVVAVPMPGTVVLRHAGGVTLARALADGRDGRPTPAPEDFVALLDRLPEVAMNLPRRTPWSGRLDFHARAAVDRHPSLAPRVEAVQRALEPLLAAAPTGPLVPTHSDPYVANVFVRDGRPHALIDLDGLGPGHRVDDLATALAHLAVLPPLAPESYPHVPAVVRNWHRAFEWQPHIDRVALRARVAAVIVSLVAAASPEQAIARVALAEDWLERARRADGRGAPNLTRTARIRPLTASADAGVTAAVPTNSDPTSTTEPASRHPGATGITTSRRTA